MPTKKTVTKKTSAADVPSLFRLNVEVGDLERAARFYGKLFGLEGPGTEVAEHLRARRRASPRARRGEVRKQAGARCYLTCGPVTLQVVDVSSHGKPHPAAKALYFMVKDLEAVFARAQELKCLSKEDVHGTSGGAIAVRPWGERSFYAEDPWRNPLCFVEAGTVYPG